MPTEDESQNKKTHPSFGLLSFSRATSSHDQKLFGSSIGHKNTMRLELHEAELHRSLNYDRYHPCGKLFEIEMSPTQFAELITSANCGVGVPVTIRWSRTTGNTPPVPFETKRLQFEKEFARKIQQITKRVSELEKAAQTKLEATGPITKAERLQIAEILYSLAQDIRDNIPFVQSMWNEQLDTTVNEAKGEVEGFFRNLIMQLGAEHLVEKLEEMLPSIPNESSIPTQITDAK